MGANIGTTVTAWLLSLSGISGDSLFLQLLKPSSFTPVLAVIGIILYLTDKGKKKDTGLILLGFATLMFGMESLSGSVSGLRNDPNFTKFFLMFSNPILGVLAGAILTGIVQSSSASVGILQALSSTGAVSYGAAIPIIMGQNIGTCVTAMLSSVGTNKNARRAAVVHLSFNIIGTIVWLTAFETANLLLHFSFVDQPIDTFQIAVIHSIFNVLCTLMLLPCCGLLEKLSYRLIPETDHPDTAAVLDERLFATPAIALVKSEELTKRMAADAELNFSGALALLENYSDEDFAEVQRMEGVIDRYEDILGTYLVKLTGRELTGRQSADVSKFLHTISDFERISDHALNVAEAAQEIHQKGITFSGDARHELSVLTDALREILHNAIRAFIMEDLELAKRVEPLEELIDALCDEMKLHHVDRLQKGVCTLSQGFVFNDLLTNYERVADHCSNIAVAMIELESDSFDTHEYLNSVKEMKSDTFARYYEEYSRIYQI